MQYRKIHRELIPLKGLQNTSIYIVLTEEIKNKLMSIENLYEQLSSEKKVKDIILLDAFHSATIEGARTTVENVRKSFDKPKTKDDKKPPPSSMFVRFNNSIAAKFSPVL